MTDEVVKFLDKYGDKISASYKVLKEQSKWHDVMVYWIIISTIILVIGLIFVTVASFGTDSFVILFNTVFSVWLSWQLAPDYNLINNLINR